LYFVCFFSVAQQLYSSLDCLIFGVSRSHTIRHTRAYPPPRTHTQTWWGSSEREIALSQRHLFTHKTNIGVVSWIRSYNASNQAATELRAPTVIGCLSFSLPKIRKLNTVFRKLYISVLIYKVERRLWVRPLRLNYP